MPTPVNNFPIAPQPVAPLPDPMEYANRSKEILGNAIPGLDNLTAGASGVVNNLLGGLPSTSTARRANAFYGGRSGMPSSDFVRNRGFDLYNEQADKYQQRGFDDFLALLRGTSGTIAPTTGEQLQSNQFDRNFQQRQVENNQEIEKFNVNTNLDHPVQSRRVNIPNWSGSPMYDIQNPAYRYEYNDPLDFAAAGFR